MEHVIFGTRRLSIQEGSLSPPSAKHILSRFLSNDDKKSKDDSLASCPASVSDKPLPKSCCIMGWDSSEHSVKGNIWKVRFGLLGSLETQERKLLIVINHFFCKGLFISTCESPLLSPLPFYPLCSSSIHLLISPPCPHLPMLPLCPSPPMRFTPRIVHIPKGFSKP